MNIVVTGLGIISALGIGKADTLAALKAQRSGIGPMRYLTAMHNEFPVGEVPYSNDQLRKMYAIDEATPISRTSLLGIAALDETLADAGIDRGNLPNINLISGTTVGGMDITERYYTEIVDHNIHGEYLRLHDCGTSTEMIANHFGRFRSMTTLSTACSSAANAIITGAEMIRNGLAECVVAGGSECLTTFHFEGFNSLKILDNEPCRPFDAERAGINLGEGAAWIVLESEEHALRRGAKIQGVLAGYGNRCDAYHQTASSPDGNGAYEAMKEALEMAGLTPQKIDYINAHGTGTGNNDASECNAMRRLFGDNVPPFSSTKPFTGHTTSASGSIEAVICLLAMRHAFLPANLNFTHAVDCLTPITGTRQQSINNVLCNAFGFGGNDSSLLFSTYPDAQHSTFKIRDSKFTKTYILSSTQISAQQPLSEDWIDNPLTINEPLTHSHEADYKRHIPPLEARRMGPLLKRAITTAYDALEKARIDSPEAIITGTGLGCIDYSQRILNTLCYDSEPVISPTHFMQSTHNTISSLIAIRTKTHAYNATYSHNSISFQSALMDAFMQLRSGKIGNALVCAHDEMPDNVYNIIRKAGLMTDQHAAECATAFCLSNKHNNHVLCELAGMTMLYRPTDEEKIHAIKELLHECDVEDNYIIYDHNDTLFGTSMTAAALDLYAATHLIQQQPVIVRHDSSNHYTLILLKPCSDC